MRRVLGAFLIAAAALAATDAASQTAGPYAVPQRLVKLADGRRINLYCTGQGAPTVVLDAGLGMGTEVWSKVQPEIAKTTRVCAYDRAGYGFSDPGPLPRDARNRTADLKAVLDAAGERGPFIFVAHSMSGFTARLLAATDRSYVAGVVLIDPNIDGDDAALKAAGPQWARVLTEGQTAAMTCIRAVAAGEMKPGGPAYEKCGAPPSDDPLARPAMAQAVLSEKENVPADDRAVREAGTFPYDIPLAVLTAGGRFGPKEGATDEERPKLRRIWASAHADLASQSQLGFWASVPNANHVIQVANPAAVVAPILAMVNFLRPSFHAED